MSNTDQGLFVGRAGELAALRDKLAAAHEGHGNLVLIVGEAGIGKTALARAFADEASDGGARVLWGACLEGDWQPPYGPWAEALGAHARGLDDERLRQELGANAAPLGRLLPSLPLRWPDLPPVAQLRPEDERFRLYDAVAQWLLAIASDTPLVLVLDDLHWADRDSLGLLRYVTRVVGHSPLLLIGTYRDPDPEFDRRGALGDLLAILQRETAHTRLVLGGLGHEQVATYLRSAAGQELPGGLVRAIDAESGGNPFYLREVFRHLVEEGTIVRRAGRWSTDASLNDLGIPEGVRAVLNQRLLRLGELTNRLLHQAAAFTGGFTFELIRAVSERDEEAVLDSLDEALRAGLLRVAQPGPPATYDFAHAIVRHTLYDALNPDRRARLHRRIAEVLERLPGATPATRDADLAAQYHASRALPGAERGIPHALAAATAARDGYAHERAAQYLRMARDLATGQDVPTRRAILERLALAEAEALLIDEARLSAEAADALADAEGDPQQRAAFLATIARALKEGGATRALWEPLVERGLTLVGERRNLTWARLALLLDRIEPIVAGPLNLGQWQGYDPQAAALARVEGGEDDYAHTLESFDWRSRAEVDDLLALARTWQRPTAIIWTLNVAVRDLIYRHGDLKAALELLHDLLERSRRYGTIPGEAEALVQIGLVQAILGEQSSAREAVRRADERVAQLGTDHRLRFAINAVGSVVAYFYDGDWVALAEAVRVVALDWRGRGSQIGLTASSFTIYNQLRAGDATFARELLAAVTPAFDRIARTSYVYGGSIDRIAAAVWELGAAEYAARYRELIEELMALQLGDGPLKTFELIAARMAAIEGDLPAATANFARARVVLGAAGHRPMRAIVDYDEALALVRANSTDRARIAALLDAASTQFVSLGMGGWEQRARALRDERASGRAGERAILAPTSHTLTPREAEVLRLVAGGNTNREIAETLFLSVPTVQRHIANIYNKIGARGRADATAYALRHGFLPESAD